jgi:aspartate aminotransferase-like enzyme
MMRSVTRRSLLVGSLAGLAVPLAVGAQQAGKVWRIGWLSGASAERDKTVLAAFQQGLAALAYVEGKSISIDHVCGTTTR